MRVVGFSQFGRTGDLAVTDADAPPVGPDEVLIRTAATSVNPADTWFWSGGLTPVQPGWELPMWAGIEVAGYVEDVGGAATGFARGQFVIGAMSFMPRGRGTHSEYVALPATAVAIAPAYLTPAAATTLPVNALTALCCVDASGTAAGDRLAVTGAGGAVGRFVVQVAVRRGIEVVAVANERYRAELLELGASQVLTGAPGDWTGRSPRERADAVVDAAILGNACASLIAPTGVIVPLRPAPYDAIAGARVAWPSVFDDLETSGNLDRVGAELARGTFGPLPTRCFALREAVQAFEFYDSAGRGADRPVLDWS